MDPRSNEVLSSLVQDAAPTPEEAAPAEPEAPENTDDVDYSTAPEPEDRVEEQDDADDAEEVDEDPDSDAEGVETYTLTIDGEEQDVTIDELVKAYQIDGAAQKRLQEATEARKAAVEEGRAEGMKVAEAEIQTQRMEITQSREQLGELVGLIGGQLFAEQVQRPDPALEQSDPIRYLSDMEHWRQDQQRIQGLQQQLVRATEQQRAEKEAYDQQVMAENRRQLLAKRPDLQGADSQKTFTENVRRAQEAVGFTNEEVNAFPDHRGLLLLDLLGQRLAQEQSEGPTPAQRVVQKAKKPMAPGAVKYKRTKAQKQHRADRERAQKSGDYRDVAKLLIQDAPRR